MHRRSRSAAPPLETPKQSVEELRKLPSDHVLHVHLQALTGELLKVIPLGLEEPVLIGRAMSDQSATANGFFSADSYPTISRTHARLSLDAKGRMYIVDAESRTGTWLNNIRIGNQPARFRLGDVLKLGKETPMKLVECPFPPCLCLKALRRGTQSVNLKKQLVYEPRVEEAADTSFATQTSVLTAASKPKRKSVPNADSLMKRKRSPSHSQPQVQASPLHSRPPSQLQTPVQQKPVLAVVIPHQEQANSFFPERNPVSIMWTPTMGNNEPLHVETVSFEQFGDQLGSQEPFGHGVDSNDPEFELLDESQFDLTQTKGHQKDNAPLITRDAMDYGVEIGQYGLLGQIRTIHTADKISAPLDPRIYVNTNAPFSAVICGVQGSGKSHSSSILLENMFIPNPRLGKLLQPLCGLVLHFGDGGSNSKPCEAAFLSEALNGALHVQVPNVVVYVSPSSLSKMERIYSRLPNVKVLPLRFREDELDARGLLSLMAVGSNSDNAPLYIQTVLSILRDLGDRYSFRSFRAELNIKKKDFNPSQKAGLEQRMAILENFLAQDQPFSGQGWASTSANGNQHESRFRAGQVTIVDLSDIFIDSHVASGLFDIITRNFERVDVGTGKVLMVDEAHKYLRAASGEYKSGLTQTLISLSRQQRHQAMRLIISTQEPTVVPAVLLDLCTIAIIHRFSSSSWWNHLAQHLAAEFADDTFDRVVKLQTGEAIVVAPSALSTFGRGNKKLLEQLGRRFLVVRTRKKLTADGGKSRLVTDDL